MRDRLEPYALGERSGDIQLVVEGVAVTRQNIGFAAPRHEDSQLASLEEYPEIARLKIAALAAGEGRQQ
jgi:hypothetical protein